MAEEALLEQVLGAAAGSARMAAAATEDVARLRRHPDVPLPAKIVIRVLPEIDLKRELGAKADEDDAYELVTGKMQTALSRLSSERSMPIVG